MTNEWTELHPAFAKETSYSYQTWQQEWAKKGFTSATAQAWISAGFAPNDLIWVQQWTNLHFTPAEAKQWLAVGLRKGYDSTFARWLRDHNHSPTLVPTKLAQLRTEYNQAWLTEHYPDYSIKALNISSQGLTGTLNLSHYPQLEKLICSHNHLTSLNFLATLPSPEKLIWLDLSYNPPISTLDSLAALVSLEFLDLRSTKVHGSLAPLSQCRKLKTLYISNTQLASDPEYLPAQLEKIYAKSMPALKEKMTGFVNKYGAYDYQSWRAANQNHPLIQLIDSNDKLLAEKDTQISTLQAQLKEKNEELTNKQTKLTQATTKSTVLEKNLVEEQQAHQQTKLELGQALVELTKLQQAEQDLTNEQLSLQEQLLQQQAQIQRLEDQIKKLTLNKLTTELAQAQKVLTKLVSDAQQKLTKELHFFLNTLLRAQQALLHNAQNSFAQEQLNEVKSLLLASNQLTNEQIANLLHWRSKVTQLESKVAQISAEERLEACTEAAPPAYQE